MKPHLPLIIPRDEDKGMVARLSMIVASAIAVTLALAGCSAPPLPEGLSDDEVRVILDRNNAMRWESYFPAEPMPVVEPLGTINPFSPGPERANCLQSFDIEGLTVTGDGGYSYSGTDSDELDRAQVICNARYPFDPA